MRDDDNDDDDAALTCRPTATLNETALGSSANTLPVQKAKQLQSPNPSSIVFYRTV